jgi:hypothetical protein
MPRSAAYEIELSAEVRAELEHRAACYALPFKEFQRARLVLYAAEGQTNREIAGAPRDERGGGWSLEAALPRRAASGVRGSCALWPKRWRDPDSTRLLNWATDWAMAQFAGTEKHRSGTFRSSFGGVGSAAGSNRRDHDFSAVDASVRGHGAPARSATPSATYAKVLGPCPRAREVWHTRYTTLTPAGRAHSR